MATTAEQLAYLDALRTLGRGSLVAIDKALLDAHGRYRRQLIDDRAAIAADVERLDLVLGRG